MALFFKRKKKLNTEESIAQENNYIEDLQKQTKIQMEKFEQLTPEQIENEILISVGVNRALINNPRTRALLVRKMLSVGMPEFSVLITDKVEICNADGKVLGVQDAFGYIKNILQNKWNIYDEAVELPKEEFDGFCERTILKVCEKNIEIEKKSHIEGHLENEKYNQNIIYTYNSDGLEIRHEESKKGSWNGQQLNTYSIIVRENIDKAKLTMNGKNYWLDLAYYPDSLDIADLHAIVVRKKDKIEIDNLYPDLTDIDDKEEHDLEVKKKIKSSEYSKACSRYIERKERNKKQMIL